MRFANRNAKPSLLALRHRWPRSPTRSCAEPGVGELLGGPLASLLREARVDRGRDSGVRMAGERRRLRQRQAVLERRRYVAVPEVVNADLLAAVTDTLTRSGIDLPE